MKTVDRVCGTLDSISAPYALIGARALGVRGYPRMTVDYDLLTTDRRVLEAGVWEQLEASGARVDRRKGDLDDPLAGVVRITSTGEPEVDVVVGRWTWQRAVIERSERLDVGGLLLPVPRVSDLILLKLAAGGVLDLQDVVALLGLSDRDEIVGQVDRHIPELDRDANEAWDRLRGQRPWRDGSAGVVP